MYALVGDGPLGCRYSVARCFRWVGWIGARLLGSCGCGVRCFAGRLAGRDQGALPDHWERLGGSLRRWAGDRRGINSVASKARRQPRSVHLDRCTVRPTACSSSLWHVLDTGGIVMGLTAEDELSLRDAGLVSFLTSAALHSRPLLPAHTSTPTATLVRRACPCARTMWARALLPLSSPTSNFASILRVGA